jgi:HAD superfamily hydrolase (TIGR01509 family)
MTIKALIFDVDGTLAETEELHRRAFNETFAAAGLDWAWDRELYAQLLAVTGGKERIAHFIANFGGRPELPPDGIARLHADKTRLYARLVAEGALSLRPGVERLLREARANGVRLAIATTTTLSNVEALLGATLGLDGPAWFEVIAAGDDVRAKKPAPDIYRLALRLLDLPAADCIAIEDTMNGLLSAQGAGVPTVVTISAYGGRGPFPGALAVLDDLDGADLATLIQHTTASVSRIFTTGYDKGI